MNYLKQPSIFKGRCYVCFGECHWLKYSKNIWTELRTPYFEHWEITHGWNPKIHLIWVSNPSGGTTLGLQNVFMTFRGPMVFLDLVPFFKSFRNSTKHPTPQPINFQNIVTTVTKKNTPSRHHVSQNHTSHALLTFFFKLGIPSCLLVESTWRQVHNLDLQHDPHPHPTSSCLVKSISTSATFTSP